MSTDLLDAETLNTQILPFVDGIITTSGNASIAQLVAFSAPSDPGVRLPSAVEPMSSSAAGVNTLTVLLSNHVQTLSSIPAGASSMTDLLGLV